ncbi:MAG: hypothetical protein EXS25_00255 [Pedosphaera sp.]|nr:hypothetical protein [Pedosphaera sp.]
MNKKREYYSGNPKLGQMQRVPVPDERMKELEEDAIALFQTADSVYMTRNFRVNLSSTVLREKP